MRDDELSLLQEFVSDAYALAQQSPGITPQIEDQPFQIAERIECFGDFMFRSFVEAVDVHVADARLDQEMHIHAVTRNLVAH